LPETELLFAQRALEALPLSQKFYLSNTDVVARRLLGKVLVVTHADASVPLVCKIVEVEAYLGDRDPASHAFRGQTKRNWPMFRKGGTCYVYLSYGLNYCMNVSTLKEGIGEAVLLRAAEPLCGLREMERRRHAGGKKLPLTNGPGRLCQALGVDLSYNGFTFDRLDLKIVDLGLDVPISRVGTSSRIGISKAADLPLRFFEKGSSWLSRKG